MCRGPRAGRRPPGGKPMPRKRGKAGRGPTGRSAAQQQGNVALTCVMKAWEHLNDQERLTWRVQGKLRRTNGISYFKHINLRRLRRGEELARVPPQSKPYDDKPVLKGLDLRNRVGWLTLKLEFHRKPTAPMTVWCLPPARVGG